MTNAEFHALSEDEQDAWIAARVRKGLEEALGDQYPDVLEAIHAEREAAERRIAELEFERVVRDTAIYGGVLPRAVNFIIEDARQVFELREGILRPRNGQTDPGDPLTPLQFEVWLKDQRERRSFLFESIGPKR